MFQPIGCLLVIYFFPDVLKYLSTFVALTFDEYYYWYLVGRYSRNALAHEFGSTEMNFSGVFL